MNSVHPVITGGLNKMDFRLSFDCPFSKEELRKLIHCVLYEVLFVELINYDAYIKDWSDDRQISMTATYFSLSINLERVFKPNLTIAK